MRGRTRRWAQRKSRGLCPVLVLLGTGEWEAEQEEKHPMEINFIQEEGKGIHERRDTRKDRDTGIRGFGELRSLGATVRTSHALHARFCMSCTHGPCWAWASIFSTWSEGSLWKRPEVWLAGTEGKTVQTSPLQLSLIHQNFKIFLKLLTVCSVLPRSFFAPSKNCNVSRNNEEK